MKTKLIRVTLLSMLLPVTAFAGSGSDSAGGAAQPHQEPAAEQGTTNISAEERSVLQMIHLANISDIKAGLVPFEKRAPLEIRKYAWMLIEDHAKNEQKVIGLAKRFNFELVSDEASLVAAADQANQMIESLETAPAQSFGQLFSSSMLTAHQDVLTKLEGEVNSVQSEVVKDLLQDTIDLVKQHIQQAPVGTATLQPSSPTQPIQPIQPSQPSS